MTWAFNGVVCATAGHQHHSRESFAKFDAKATGHRPPANSIPEGIPKPRLMVRTTNGIVCDATDQQHPGRQPASNLYGQGDADAIICDPISIPAGSPPPNLMATAANGIVYTTAGQQHPG